jgi:hypothetical protein
MLDSIRVSTPIRIEPSDYTIDWEAGIDEGVPYIDKLVRPPNGATVYMKYRYTQLLTLYFSASRVQNGTNAIPYDFERRNVVKNAILKLLKEELGITRLKLADFHICRLDLNRNFVYDDEKTATEVAEFSNKILPLGYENRKDYDTGLTSQTRKGRGLRVYRKDKDKRNPASEPTVRFEFQMDKKLVTRFFGYRPTLNEILSNQVSIEKVWNKAISRYALDKAILTAAELQKVSLSNLTPMQQSTLHQMNYAPCFSDKKQRTRQLAVIRKLKEMEICPYSCEVPIDLRLSVCSTIMKIRRKKILTNERSKHILLSEVILRDTNCKVKKWYLDSS